MANTSAALMMQTLTEILEYGNGTGSVNLYMAHGGTNFGYWAGICFLQELQHRESLSQCNSIICQSQDFKMTGCFLQVQT